MKKSIKLLLFFIIPALLFLSLTALAEEQYEYTDQKIANDLYKVWTISFNEELDPQSVNDSTVFVKNPFNRNVSVEVALSDDGKSVTVTPNKMYVPDMEYEIVVQGVSSMSNEVLSPSVKIPFIIEVLEEEKESFDGSQSMAEYTRSQQPAAIPEENTDTNANNQTDRSTNSNNQQSTNKTPPSQPEEEKPEHLTSIKVDVNSLVSNVTVKTSNYVATVKINGKRMHYQGNGVYELSVPALKSGQTIKVEAFATYEDNSSLERINHKVK